MRIGIKWYICLVNFIQMFALVMLAVTRRDPVWSALFATLLVILTVTLGNLVNKLADPAQVNSVSSAPSPPTT